MRFCQWAVIIGVLFLAGCGRVRMADFGGGNASIQITLSQGSPTPTPTPYLKFGLPVTKIEVLVGDSAPILRGIDLAGTNTGVAMKVTDPNSLPPGLTYSSTHGAITGIPLLAGQYTVEVCYVDENSVVNTATCKNVAYSILAEKPIPLADQRPTQNPDGLCSSSTGLGANDDPIRLTTANDLNTCVRNYPRAAFRLTNDISLGSFQGTSPADSFNPLPFFYGNFDGNGFAIRDWNWSVSLSGVTYDSGPPSWTQVRHHNGLFRGINMGAVVKGLTLENVHLDTGLTGFSYSQVNGILAGFLRGGVVRNVSVLNSSLDCTRSCGGLIGAVYNPLISNPYPTDSSTDYRDSYLNQITLNHVHLNSGEDYSNLGGLVGLYNPPFRISRAVAQDLHIIGGNAVGGIAGTNLFPGTTASSATTADSRFWLDRSSSEGMINENAIQSAFIGGLIGFVRGNDSITDSFSRMTLTSTDKGVGGLVGNLNPSVNAEKEAIVAHSYFSGVISGPVSTSGLLIGMSWGEWANGTFIGTNGIHLVHNKVETNATYGQLGTDAVTTVNVMHNSNQVFTALPDWSNPENFQGWLSSVWSFLNPYPSH